MFKNSIKTTLVVLFCIIGWGVMGQTKPVWDWAKALSGNNEDLVWGIAADSRNGVYCYGTTQSDTLRLGAQSLPGLPGKDIFLVKYDTSGTVQWAKRFGNGSNQVVGGITTDLNSNVVICGSFTGTLNIDGISLSSTGGLDVFMAKFRANGTVVWARQFSGNADDRAGRLLCDKQMNIYTVGSYNSTNFSIDAFGLPHANTYNLFYSKLDSTGSAIWAQKGSTAAFCGFYDIQITDNGQATFIGSLQSGGSLNFDPMGGIGLMSPFNSAFVLRANAATGNFISQSLVTGNRYFGSNTAMLSPQKIVFGGYNTFLTLPPTVTAELRDFNTLALQTITQPSVQGGNSTGGGVFLGPQKKIFQVSYTTGTVSYGPNLNLSLSNFVNVICEMDSALTPQNLLPMQYQPGFNANIRLLACDTATGNLYGIGSFSKSVAGGSYQLGSNSLVHQGLTDGMIFKIRQAPSPSPFKAFAGNDTTVCAGDSIVIGHPSGSIGGTPPYTYSWSPTTNLANPTAPFTQASPTSSRSYILTVVDSYGLFTKDTVTVMVKPRPTTPGISVLGSNSICWGDSATLVCTWPGGSGTYFFDWYRNGHFVQRLVNNPQYKVGESGMYAVKLIEDGSECPSLPSAPVAITVSAPLLGADTTIYQACYGDSTNLLPLYNTAGLTAVWNTATPHAVLPGVYRLSVSNANNCRDTAFVTVKLEVAMWTGAVNSDWHTPGNWNINKVPSTVTHVIISNGTPNNCVISAANATVASLQLRNGASLTMGNGMQVTMVGNCAVLPPG